MCMAGHTDLSGELRGTLPAVIPAQRLEGGIRPSRTSVMHRNFAQNNPVRKMVRSDARGIVMEYRGGRRLK